MFCPICVATTLATATPFMVGGYVAAKHMFAVGNTVSTVKTTDKGQSGSYSKDLITFRQNLMPHKAPPPLSKMHRDD